jgi:hypothetical protein
MYSQILTNIKVNLKFYRRNRLILVSSLFIFMVLGIFTLPSIFFLTKTKHLEIIKTIFSELSTFTTIITAGLGLLFISHHLSNRSIKMVFTRPCTPETWLLSSLLSALIVSLMLYTCSFFISSILFFVWHIPFQWGLLYIALNNFFKATIILSYITFLSIVLHPVLAVIIIIIFDESLFYYIKLLLISGIKTGGIKVVYLKPLKAIVDIIYLILPTTEPFEQELSRVYMSLRISDANWTYLFIDLLYTITIFVFFFLLSSYLMRKKRYI